MDAAHDPASDGFGRTLDAAAFGRMFGLSAHGMDRVKQQLGEYGLVVTAEYPQRTAIMVRGSAADVSRSFHVALGDFVTESGAQFHAPLEAPRIPTLLRGSVVEVSGLSDRPLLHPSRPLWGIPHPETGLTPDDAAHAYGVDALHAMGIQGQGQTIAIVSFATFYADDVRKFDDMFGINGSPVEVVSVNGGPGATNEYCDPGPEICHSGEVSLDIDVIRGLAPAAQILDYEGPNAVGFAPIVNQMVADGRVDIVSISWGSCDKEDRSQAEEQAFQAAEAQGISIFVASGDAGAYDCQHSTPTDVAVSVDYPADSPSVVAVGGTLLSVREDGGYLEEAGWEDVLSGGGGGGGLNPLDPRPTWQDGPGVTNEFSNGNRQVPDVAAAADPDSGFAVVHQGSVGGVGGTSASAPFWAGSMLLIDQFAGTKGIDTLGFVNPMLYHIAANPQPFPAFHDVVRGGNRLYNATPGWDYATGLGSPDVWNLARDVVRFMQTTS